MGTWTTDIIGTGLAHHDPTKQERVLARRIAKRWKEWYPVLVHELRARPHPPGYVAREIIRMEHVHAKALAAMLQSGPRWYRICRRRLDDPRWTDDERAFRIAHPRLRKVKVKLTLDEKRARRAERQQLRDAAREASNVASRLARGLTPDRSVSRFIEERFPDA